MTWKQALELLSDSEAAREARDPFYVPDRTNEAVSFLFAVSTAWIIPLAPFFVPLNSQNLAVIALAALLSSVALYSGLQARSYRLNRTKAVALLRARLLDREYRLPS